jgi:hypothetical protein
MRRPTRRLAASPVEQPRGRTREVQFDDYLDYLMREIDSENKFHREAVVKFASDVQDDPLRALEWSKDVFTRAAKLAVGKDVMARVAECRQRGDSYDRPSSETIIGWVKQALHEEMLRGAKYPSHSTSPQANEVQTCKTAAFADLYDRIVRHLDFLNR